MVSRTAALVLFVLCSTQLAETGDLEPLPPPAVIISEPTIVIEDTIAIPYSYDSVTGRRLSARLEVASSIVRGHFRARIGSGHPATWLADSVRRKADQLQHGFIDGAPPELLIRNMIQLHDDVNKLRQQIAVCQLQHVQRHIPEKLQEIEEIRNQLAGMLGVPNG